MINLPLFDQLDINEYGLFPGKGTNRPGLHIRFNPGLTLILGANGLGKTTLITILYRLLTGPWDISALNRGGSLGSVELTPSALSVSLKKIFAKRVADGARNAEARIKLYIGGKSVVIKRSLSKLDLIGFEIEGEELVQRLIESTLPFRNSTYLPT